MRNFRLRAPLPAMVFSSDACLSRECGMLKEAPEFARVEDLRRAFFKGLRRSREAFRRFCADSTGDGDFRIWPVSGFGPFRYVFAEKTVLLGEQITVVFASPSVTGFYRLISPSSRYAADTVNRVLFEFLYLMDGGSPSFSRLSPEIFTAVRLLPRLSETLFSRRCAARLCDLEKIVSAVWDNVAKTPVGDSFRITFEKKRTVPENSGVITELPLEAFVSVLTVLTGVLGDISSDALVKAVLKDHGAIREITLEVLTSCIPDPDLALSEGADALFLLPEDFHPKIRYISAICLLARLDLQIACPAAGPSLPNGKRPERRLTATLIVGGELPPDLDFKYSDPTESVPGVVGETVLLFAEESVAARQKQDPEQQRLDAGSVRCQQEHDQ